VGFFGERQIDGIGVPELREWWNQEVLAAERRSVRTGRAYLDVLSAVFGYACDLELLERNPVPAFRETLRRRSGTKGARAGTDPGRKVRPIERPDELAAMVREAEAEGLVAQAFVLLSTPQRYVTECVFSVITKTQPLFPILIKLLKNTGTI
jgi:hypothetical protein